MTVALYRKDMTLECIISLTLTPMEWIRENGIFFRQSDFWVQTDEGFIRVYIEK